jgi:hypothetical protein
MLKFILKPVIFYFLFGPVVGLFSILLLMQVNPFRFELLDMMLMSYLMGGIPSLATGFWIQNKIFAPPFIIFMIVSTVKGFMCSLVFALILLVFTANLFYGDFVNFLMKAVAFGCLGAFSTFICVLLAELLKKYTLSTK